MPNFSLKGCIYTIKNKINGKLYVGRTNNYRRRYIEHFGKKDSCTILRKAFSKYGKANFEMQPVISFTASNSQVLDEVLNLLEKYFIEKYNTYKSGYNATLGGEGNSGWIVSKETRAKRSLSLSGRKVSEEEKQRLLSYVKNRVWTAEQREHQRQIMLNRDPKIQERIAAKLKGRRRNVTWGYKRLKPVLQYTLDGKFIKEYAGPSKVDGFNSANIIACCNGKTNSAYGYIWKYKKTDNYPLKINSLKQYHISNKPVIQYDKNGSYIAEYNSATLASEKTTIGRKAITNCLTGRSNSAGGYVWKYKSIGGIAV